MEMNMEMNMNMNMNQTITVNRQRNDANYLAFFDGDTLAAALPGKPDYSYFARLMFYQLKQAQRKDRVQRVLIDCLLLTEIDFSAFDTFVDLGRGLQRLSIELVLLDAPERLRNYLSPRLPAANWIESSIRPPEAVLRWTDG